MSGCIRRGQTEWMFVAITIDEVHSDKSEAIPDSCDRKTYSVRNINRLTPNLTGTQATVPP